MKAASEILTTDEKAAWDELGKRVDFFVNLLDSSPDMHSAKEAGQKLIDALVAYRQTLGAKGKSG